MTTDLHIERLLTPEDWANLMPEWERLDEQIRPRTPFTSPAWIDLWWQHFRRRNLLFRDEFFCHIARDATGRLIGIAPLMQTNSPGYGLPALRLIQFFGTDPMLTEIRGVICRGEDHTRVVQALAAHFLREDCKPWDVFKWNGLQQAPPSYEEEFIVRRDLPAYIVDLPGSWDELRSRVSRNMRKNLRRAYELLARDGLEFVFRTRETVIEAAPAMERFFSLHTARNRATNMVYHRDQFTSGRSRVFLTEYLRNAAARGHLRIFELDIDKTVVASRLALVLGQDLYLYYSGYLPSWRKYSVMTVLMSEIIRWAIGQRLQRVNLTTGRDQSKLRWKPPEVIYRDAIQFSPARRPLALPSLRACEALSRVREQVQALKAIRLPEF